MFYQKVGLSGQIVFRARLGPNEAGCEGYYFNNKSKIILKICEMLTVHLLVVDSFILYTFLTNHLM